MATRRTVVGVIGAGAAAAPVLALAEEVGRLLAEAGCVVLCGGRGGVMEAAARGAQQAGGDVIGLLPGTDAAGANRHVTIALPTGLGEARNAVIAQAAGVLIAIAGGYGTLSEIALALKAGRRVIGLDSWAIDGVEPARDAAEAVARALGR
ncbi:MAG: TIGR00725 family protein [Planctomycetes bacterium]|nr:TIGR00725 family protein [Planctomycetota bacterium]